MADGREIREAILLRRRAFVTAALAGAGVTLTGCDACNPEPCLSPPATTVCLTVVAMPSDAGVANKQDAAMTKDGATESDVGDGGADGGQPDAGKTPPRPCLRARPCLSVRPCLSQQPLDKPPAK